MLKTLIAVSDNNNANIAQYSRPLFVISNF